MSKDLSFEAIVHALMLEEPTPSYEALARWQKRYPKYRDSLAEYFADWAMDLELPPPGPEVEIDEDALVQKGADYAMDLLRREDGFIPKTSVEKLSPFNQIVLAAVFLLRGSGSLSEITDKVSEMSGKRIVLGATIGSLASWRRKDWSNRVTQIPRPNPNTMTNDISWSPWPANGHSLTRGQTPRLSTAS